MKLKYLLLLIIIILAVVGAVFFLMFREAEETLWTDSVKETGYGATVVYGPPRDPFNHPVGIAVYNDKIYVADADNHRIRIFDREWRLVGQFGRFGSRAGELGYPVSVAVNSLGEVFVSEIHNNRIQVFTANGQFLRPFPADPDRVKGPSALCVDNRDMVYVFDRGEQKVRLFTREGKPAGTFGGRNNPGEQLRYVMGMAVAGNGDLYISDSGNRSIKIFDRKGGLKGHLNRNMPGLPALNLPRGLAVISENRFAVADALSQKVYLIFRRGQDWQSQTFNHAFVLPDGACYRAGRLYVTDRGNNSVVVFANVR